jgi:tRNA A37 threonylcarbamoyladenosine synthetase subunit TsaC/SUA5/YrdC
MGIYALKGRTYTKPLAVIVRSFADIREMIEITEEQGEFLIHYPFPFTIVGKAKSLPPFLEPQQYTTLGIRVAERALDPDIISELSFPLFLTSANRSGMPELMTREAVRDEFSDSVTIL